MSEENVEIVRRLTESFNESGMLLSVDHFRGQDGIEIDQPAGMIITRRRGKIVRMQAFWKRATALEAAGLTD